MLPNFYKNATIYYDFTTTTAVTNAFFKKNRNKKITFALHLQSCCKVLVNLQLATKLYNFRKRYKLLQLYMLQYVTTLDTTKRHSFTTLQLQIHIDLEH